MDGEFGKEEGVTLYLVTVWSVRKFIRILRIGLKARSSLAYPTPRLYHIKRPSIDSIGDPSVWYSIRNNNSDSEE